MPVRKLFYVAIVFGFLCFLSGLSFVGVKAAKMEPAGEIDVVSNRSTRGVYSDHPSFAPTNDVQISAQPKAPATHEELVEIGAFQVSQGIQITDTIAENVVPLVRDECLNCLNLDNYKPFVIRVAAQSLSTPSLPVVIRATLTFSSSRLFTRRIMTSTHLSLTMPSLDDDSSFAFEYDPSKDWQGNNANEVRVSIQIYSDENPPHLLAEKDAITYPIITTQTPQIFFYDIPFPDQNKPITSTTNSKAAAGFITGILPAADSGDLYRRSPVETFICDVVDIPKLNEIGIMPVYDYDPNAPPNADEGVLYPSEMCAIFHNLYAIRNGLAACGSGPDLLTLVYGWTLGNPTGGLHGFAHQNGSVAFGNTESVRGQRTFAHEIMHNFGFSHDEQESSIGYTGWDVGDKLRATDGVWSENQIGSAYKSSSLFDITVPEKETNDAWISPGTYRELIEKLDTRAIEQPNLSCLVRSDLGNHEANQVHHFCVGINQENDNDFYAYPFPFTLWQWDLPTNPPPPGTPGVFTITVTMESGEVITSLVDGRVGTDPVDGYPDLIYGFLNAALPYTAAMGSIVNVTIADPEGDVVPIYDRTRGIFGDVLTNPQVGFTPTITITNPFSGTVIESPEFTVSWAVEGATPAQVRRYEFQVLYSHNGGRIWAPLAVNLPGFLSEVSIPREQLCTTQALNGEKFPGILRVVGSDGLNSGYVDVYISLLGDQSEYCERGPVRAIDIPLSESGSLLDNIDTGTRNQSPVDTNGGSINQ